MSVQNGWYTEQPSGPGVVSARGEWVLDWPRAAAAGPRVCGGKGWNLARLDRYGFPVPERPAYDLLGSSIPTIS